jgi:hypothetical protein
MIKAVRPQADFLRRNERLWNDSPLRADVALFVPFRRWLETDHCIASNLAAALTAGNFQYRVVCEDNFDLTPSNGRLPALLVESRNVFTPAEKSAIAAFEQKGGHVVTADKGDWLAALNMAIGEASIEIIGPRTVRGVVHDQPDRTILHVYNLNVQRLSSFDDKVTPVKNVQFHVRVPFEKIGSIRMESADETASHENVIHEISKGPAPKSVHIVIPTLAISAVVVIEP